MTRHLLLCVPHVLVIIFMRCALDLWLEPQTYEMIKTMIMQTSLSKLSSSLYYTFKNEQNKVVYICMYLWLSDPWHYCCTFFSETTNQTLLKFGCCTYVIHLQTHPYQLTIAEYINWLYYLWLTAQSSNCWSWYATNIIMWRILVLFNLSSILPLCLT